MRDGEQSESSNKYPIGDLEGENRENIKRGNG